jgi:NAD+ synthase (glutamine-hydrolysing)
MDELRIGLGQINPTMGDLEGNTKKILRYIQKAREKKADIIAFPELAITGYYPKDLLLKKDFVNKNQKKLEDIRKKTQGIAVIIGFVDSSIENEQRPYDFSKLPYHRNLYNAAALIKDKELIGIQHKTHLPTYDVFDEKRYFIPSDKVQVFKILDITLGINICEDIWIDNGPACQQMQQGADLIINISASPFYQGKDSLRRNIISRRSRTYSVPIVYVNMVGGQDELVFDGGSYIFNQDGKVIAQCKKFREDLVVSPINGKEIIITDNLYEEVYDALTLGVKDYVKKTGFKKVVIGLSGGIDSAVVAAIATRALGKQNVIGVQMPSIYTKQESIRAAEQVAKNLGIIYKCIPITTIYTQYLQGLKKEFQGMTRDATEENIQARIRGNILMALSNKFNYLVLSCGNKSELSIGYVTLYGDMAGGLAVISDVTKTMVYGLARHMNHKKIIIPSDIITKEPSAELRENQKDTDDIPPYDILDPILQAYIADNKSRQEIISMGYDKKMVNDIVHLIDHNEYKRKQAAIGIKITPRAFGFGRRMPIVNKYF